MNILVIDTATEACSVALRYNGRIISRFEVCPQQHSQKLLPMVQGVLEEADITLKQLDGLAFGRGPGSFTGVRIATGMIQGLALGAELPVVGVSTLAAMAQQAMDENGSQHVATAIDARMGEVYLGFFEYRNGLAEPVIEEQVVPPQAALDILAQQQAAVGVGTGWQAYPELGAESEIIVESDIILPDARAMLALAHAAFEAGEQTNADQVQPVYLRDKVTWKKLPGRE
ncbi:tRNA threonylcarbamoyladenosine biosynthesis protein TsaB [Saliniradius amylolyticus]|uniref:tRNA threonylcarbamoyladenosine biosynthesis protein TsaB n=1 Tax=Saliniradius amylolyticus TaxID=2183582 RepID=A0A2S2E3X7_9ALTE|nr:tRNA (adenosine(37)-N6)-threonylcarbamoyltransferase complex dimerization subunit type 1 TsaB [Saliniradius amylolyticus]AWL12299.1 tRNA threonylcarbamoyladenosine biosynthesis protein TsaB [Saliniradius amylolyticus]